MNLVTRQEWGAAPPARVTPVQWFSPMPLWVHHSAGPAPAPEDEAATVRGIQRHHLVTKGWRDIGYAFLVAPSGTIYEGHQREVTGVHCPGHNGEPSVCLMGDYTSKAPTKAAHRAVWALHDHLGLRGGLRGHRQGVPTTCPGEVGFRFVVLAPRPPVSPEPKPPPPDGDTLRIAIQSARERNDGSVGRTWADWGQAGGALAWFRTNSLPPTSRMALAFQGTVRRYRPERPEWVEITHSDGEVQHITPKGGGAKYMGNVAATLANKYL